MLNSQSGGSLVFGPHTATRVLRLSGHEGGNRYSSSELGLFVHEVYLDAVVQHDFSAVPLLEKHWGPLVVVTAERLREAFPLDRSSDEDELESVQTYPKKETEESWSYPQITADDLWPSQLAYDTAVLALLAGGYWKVSRWSKRSPGFYV
jgi:hypothetical protein